MKIILLVILIRPKRFLRLFSLDFVVLVFFFFFFWIFCVSRPSEGRVPFQL